MMGSRGYKGADECDAFSRKSRNIIGWKRGELRVIKRRFWKRLRKSTHKSTFAAVPRGPEAM
jgi:hypothetical protein